MPRIVLCKRRKHAKHGAETQIKRLKMPQPLPSRERRRPPAAEREAAGMKAKNGCFPLPNDKSKTERALPRALRRKDCLTTRSKAGNLTTSAALKPLPIRRCIGCGLCLASAAIYPLAIARYLERAHFAMDWGDRRSSNTHCGIAMRMSRKARKRRLSGRVRFALTWL